MINSISGPFTVKRLGDGPIIVPGMDDQMGANINGPSLIRVPDWITDALGRYYLYFAHHNGKFIRLAYADDLIGPWQIYSSGTLQHQESWFPAEIAPMPPGRLRPGQVEPIPHIASPDVHIDHHERRIRMYYHGIEHDRQQVTRVAISTDGINFVANEPVLGNPYWRGFEHDGWHYGLAMPGVFYRSRDPLGPFEEGPTLFTSNMRHSAVLVENDIATVFYTNVGDEPPERIMVTTIDLNVDWRRWRTAEVHEVLSPERDYEGANLPLIASMRGEITEPANQLRDPAIFREDGRVYLLYSVAGESGIALAEVVRD